MKKVYDKFCTFESTLSLLLLAGIAVLVFVSAIMRTLGVPLNWAQDAALVAFAWLVFIGGDVAVRNTGLIGINVIVKHFPTNFQKILNIIFQIIIMGFLAILVIFGIQMVLDGYQRQINTLHISYAFVTASVPVGAFLMIISTATRIAQVLTIRKENWETETAEEEL